MCHIVLLRFKGTKKINTQQLDGLQEFSEYNRKWQVHTGDHPDMKALRYVWIQPPAAPLLAKDELVAVDLTKPTKPLPHDQK